MAPPAPSPRPRLPLPPASQRAMKITNYGWSTRRPRPGYQTLLTAIRTNQAEAVLITEMARLYRRPDELLDLIKLAEQTSLKHIITIDEAGYDLSTGQGIHNAASAVSGAMLESRRTSNRMKRKIRAKARDGAGHGGRRPYGYELGWMALRKEEAEVVRWMVKRVIAGETINGVVKQLNEEGIPTATGKMWHHTLVRQILTRPRIAGIRSHNGSTYKGAFPAIITVGEWELLQLSLAKLRRTHTGGVQQGRKYLLTGLVYCGKCGQPMMGGAHHGSREARSKPRYRCEKRVGINPLRCGKVIRLAEPVDLLVTEAALHALDSMDHGHPFRRHAEPDTKPLLEQYQRLQRRKRDLVDDYASGLLTRAELTQAKETVEGQIEQVQNQLVQLQPQRASEVIPEGQTVREAWEKGSLAWRRAILRTLIDRVVIKPATSSYSFYHGYRFSPKSIEIQWNR
jgi:site-specific DNA recombinase